MKIKIDIKKLKKKIEEEIKENREGIDFLSDFDGQEGMEGKIEAYENVLKILNEN